MIVQLDSHLEWDQLMYSCTGINNSKRMTDSETTVANAPRLVDTTEQKLLF